MLNLSGSLIEEVNPMDKLEYINLIENLTVLELGDNQVRKNDDYSIEIIFTLGAPLE